MFRNRESTEYESIARFPLSQETIALNYFFLWGQLYKETKKLSQPSFGDIFIVAFINRFDHFCNQIIDKLPIPPHLSPEFFKRQDLRSPHSKDEIHELTTTLLTLAMEEKQVANKVKRLVRKSESIGGICAVRPLGLTGESELELSYYMAGILNKDKEPTAVVRYTNNQIRNNAQELQRLELHKPS